MRLCDQPTLFVDNETFPGTALPGGWSTQLSGTGATVDAGGGELVARKLLGDPGWALAFRLSPPATSGRVRYKLRLAGKPQRAQVGCKIILGKLAGEMNVNARLSLQGTRLYLEVGGSAGSDAVSPLLDPVPPGPFDVTVTLSKDAGAGTFVAEARVADPSAEQRTEVSYPIPASLAGEASIRCGIPQSDQGPPDASLEAYVTDLTAEVCP
jgi:hypothetical protein